MTKTVVALIPNKNGEYLFLQRGKGQDDGVVYSFPSGKINPDETKEQAVIREVLEETGVICEPVAEIGNRQINENIHLYYWRANYVSGEPRDPDDGEVTNVAFRSVAEILTLVPRERLHQSVQSELGITD